jgi:hypothetical protein
VAPGSCVERNDSIILNEQLGRIWKELVVAYSKVSQHFSGGAEKIYDKSLSGL